MTELLQVGVLLALGAIAFPVSRIPRIEILAHIADLLLLIPMIRIGYSFIYHSNPNAAVKS
jgi:hypothetical protein